MNNCFYKLKGRKLIALLRFFINFFYRFYYFSVVWDKYLNIVLIAWIGRVQRVWSPFCGNKWAPIGGLKWHESLTYTQTFDIVVNFTNFCSHFTSIHEVFIEVGQKVCHSPVTNIFPYLLFVGKFKLWLALSTCSYNFFTQFSYLHLIQITEKKRENFFPRIFICRVKKARLFSVQWGANKIWNAMKWLWHQLNVIRYIILGQQFFSNANCAEQWPPYKVLQKDM